MEWWFIMARRVSVERGRGRNKSKNKITKQKKTKKNFNGERIVGWVENWSVMHTFSFLSNPLYIALFPTIQQDTTTTTEDMAVVLWAYLELFFSNLSLSRDAITTVVDQSLKSLRIVSYFFYFLFLPVLCVVWLFLFFLVIASSFFIWLYAVVVLCPCAADAWYCTVCIIVSFFLSLSCSFLPCRTPLASSVRVTSFHVQCSTLYN
jgi:hypothetical protein